MSKKPAKANAKLQKAAKVYAKKFGKKEPTLLQAFNQIQSIKIKPYPHVVWARLVGRYFTPRVIEDHIQLHPDGDYATIEQARTAIEYLASELGGIVKWS